MKKYTFKVTLTEGNNEFWEDLEARGITGCDDLIEELKSALDAGGVDFTDVTLVEFTDN